MIGVVEERTVDQARDIAPAQVEVSVVMPCLNEVETLETCVRKARKCLEENGVRGEVVVADNGSTDGSREIAARAGARVMSVEEKGYGAALMGGFRAARGKYLIMGDADDSYDFSRLMPFINELRRGHDVVMGSRFKGGIARGAMPWHHRYIGNPLLTGILNLFFHTGMSDAHCGLRALTKEAFERLDLRTTGMEFASEMVVKAHTQGLRMTEVPTTLAPDGRSRAPHLRSFRDGWRHLRFLMMLSPAWVLIYPGGAVFLLGAVLMAILSCGPLHLGRVVLDQHTMITGAMLVIVGYQGVTTGLAARMFAVHDEIGMPAPWLRRVFRSVTLERGLIGGLIVLVIGVGVCIGMVGYWALKDFGPLHLEMTLRPMLIGATLIALGSQTLLMSFFYSMLQRPHARGEVIRNVTKPR